MNSLINQVADKLLTQQKMLAVAESCTGGWLAKVCTDVPGSSLWFDRGFVTYSNEAKHDMLDVSPSTISTYGAVSQQTVEQMVQGVIQHSRAHCAIAISGVAGPGGGTEVNPVGSVWFAWLQRDHEVVTSKQIFAGDREQVRKQAVEFALEELSKLLK